jgi:hypothetical protein
LYYLRLSSLGMSYLEGLEGLEGLFEPAHVRPHTRARARSLMLTTLPILPMLQISAVSSFREPFQYPSIWMDCLPTRLCGGGLGHRRRSPHLIRPVSIGGILSHGRPRALSSAANSTDDRGSSFRTLAKLRQRSYRAPARP